MSDMYNQPLLLSSGSGSNYAIPTTRYGRTL